jgi:hypothetical protein
MQPTATGAGAASGAAPCGTNHLPAADLHHLQSAASATATATATATTAAALHHLQAATTYHLWDVLVLRQRPTFDLYWPSPYENR